MKDLTKNKILDVAENHFSKNGYYKTPLDEIVKKSNISKGGIYFHFPSKEDLFLSVMDRLAKKLLSKIEKGNLSIDNPNERLVSSLKNLLNILSSQKKLAKLLITQTNNIKSFEKKRSEIFNKFSRNLTYIYKCINIIFIIITLIYILIINYNSFYFRYFKFCIIGLIMNN